MAGQNVRGSSRLAAGMLGWSSSARSSLGWVRWSGEAPGLRLPCPGGRCLEASALGPERLAGWQAVRAIRPARGAR